MPKIPLSRRAFLAATTTTALSAWAQGGTKPNTARVVPRKVSPNEQLNIAGIGVGGKGNSDILSVKREKIVALCDVDWERGGEAFYRLRDHKPKHYHDYRKMFDEMADDIDACTISTPDHTHAPAAYRAMKLGKHVYVQKPLTHTVAEARLLQRTAKEMGVATQMGNQGHSAKGVWETCEMIWTGAIGEVREAHVWTDRPSGRWPQGEPNQAPAQPAPESLDWNLWIGTAPMRPYNRAYAPHKWRGWWDFGCGALGDMACHIMDSTFSALKLSEAKEFSVEVVSIEGRNEPTAPKQSVIKYHFPARGDMAPVDVYWYDNAQLPERPADIPADQVIGEGKNGSLFVGDGGYLTAGEYGGAPRLLPDERMAEYTKPEPFLPRRKAHYRDWMNACKGGEPACSNFDYSGPFTEMVLLGNIALRVNQKVEWDVDKMEVTNLPEANRYVSKQYREGWELPV